MRRSRATLWGLECHVQGTGTSLWGIAKGLWRCGHAPGDGLEQQVGGEVYLLLVLLTPGLAAR